MANNRFSRILLRRGTKANLNSLNPLLKEGEPIVEIDTGRMKIGDGIRRYKLLKYVGGSSVPLSATLTCRPSIVAKGNTNQEITLTYDVKGEPDNINITAGKTEYFNVTSPNTLSGNIKLNGNNSNQVSDTTTFILNTRSDDNLVTKSAKLTFGSTIFYGVYNGSSIEINGSSFDDIKDYFTSYGSLLVGALTSEGITTNDMICGNLETTVDVYVYMFIPTSLCQIVNNKAIPTFYLNTGSPALGQGGMSIFTENNGFVEYDYEYNDFKSAFTIDLDNNYGSTEKYYLFRTIQSDLGSLNIRITN